MISERILYRARQFWNALFSAPSLEDLETISPLLNPAQMALFSQMHRSEQVHSIKVMRTVMAASDGISAELRKNLLQAALLHDVGKNHYPLRLWERVLIVLAKTLTPNRVKDWGEGEARGWRRAFVIARQHPAWGAQMASAAGASPLTVSLIQRHQDLLSEAGEALEDQLLRLLQSADHEE